MMVLEPPPPKVLAGLAAMMLAALIVNQAFWLVQVFIVAAWSLA